MLSPIPAVNCFRFLSCLLLTLAVHCCLAAEDAFQSQLKPLLKQHCVDCHGADEQNGSIDFSIIADTTAAKQRYSMWRKVMDQVRSGEMPPAGQTPLKPQEKQQFADWFRTTFDTTAQPDPGPPLVRQFTRHEYSQTLRDVLRIRHDVTYDAGIPEENVVEGFANRAGGQVLEPSLMEKYFTAADLALEHLFTEPNAAGARKSLLVSVPSEKVTPEDATRNVLQAFLRRAFRRPPTTAEVEQYARIALISLAASEPFELAIRKALKPVLVSPHFLLRVETNGAEPGSVRKVNNHELAVRLSYFLWSTMPDDILAELADRGELSKPEMLEQQVRRLLTNDRANALTSQFLTQWLQLKTIHKSLPTQNHFPTFTRSLRDAMERETWLFCDHLRKQDRSVMDLLAADYTFVNAELARHYGLAEIPAKDFAQVALRPEDHRGGVLGMASMLTMTSHTDRTKPTARGKWILEVMLGAPPPPPPANVGTFPPATKDKPEPTTFREKLAQHATNPNCVGCHRRVDPLGFALENYNAIGSWRTSVGEQPVDNRGTLPGVGDFQGVDDLRKILLAKRPQFLRNLAAQTLSYALGRDVDYYDEPSLARIVAALEKNDYRFSTLVVEVVQSYPFQHRRSE